MKMELLIFALIFATCFSKWEEPIKVNNDEFNSIKPINLYYDHSTGIGYLTMLSYEKNDKQSLALRKIYPRNSRLSPFSVKDKNFGGFEVDGGNENIIHASAENGKDHIAVWSKERDDGPCDSDNTKGCVDVFYAESKDEGETWGTPRQIPRENLTDFAVRDRPSVLYIKESGRIFIFYRYYDNQGNTRTIGCVTKPSGSSIFSNEVLIAEAENAVYINTPVYSFSNNKATLHLVYLVEVEKSRIDFLYISSINGVTWEKPKKLYSSFSEYFKAYWLFSDHSIDNKAIHAIFSIWGRPDNNMIATMNSYDEGKTWTEPAEFTNAVNINSAAICGTADNPILILSASIYYPRQEYSFWVFNIYKEEFMEFEMPFENSNDISVASVSCGLYHDKLLMRAFGYISESKEAYVTFQEIDPFDLLKYSKNSH